MFFVIRSIPMSSATRVAWEGQGAQVLRPSAYFDLPTIDRLDAEFILNLGNTQFTPGGRTLSPVFNHPSDISFLQSPAQTEQRLEGLTPQSLQDTYEDEDWFWLKGPGKGGSNKVQYYGYIANEFSRPFEEWTWQPHIQGIHYRVNTVGHRCVQSHVKEGNHVVRDYTWVGLRGTPTPVKDIARAATRRLDSRDTTVAWDIVYQENTDRAFVLEGNTAPGVNDPTANRIAREIRRLLSVDDA